MFEPVNMIVRLIDVILVTSVFDIILSD